MNKPPSGWYPDPHGPGQRYFDGIDWTDVTTSPPPATANDNPGSTPSRNTAIAIGVCALSLVGVVMSMQSTNLFAGTGTIWTGVGLTAAGLAAAFFFGAEKWVRILAVITLVIAVFSAGYMEKQVSDKRDEISRMFNTSTLE